MGTLSVSNMVASLSSYEVSDPDLVETFHGNPLEANPYVWLGFYRA